MALARLADGTIMSNVYIERKVAKAMAKKYKPDWTISYSRPAIETYSPIEGIRKWEPSPTCSIGITLIDNAGKSQQIDIYNIKPEDLIVTMGV